MEKGGSVTADALRGAVAGAVGVWVMDRVDWSMFEHEDEEARRRTESVRPDGKDPAHLMAGRAAEAVGLKAVPQPHPAGIAVHYALGIGPAALYGALRDRVPAVGAGRGALYGLAVFLLHDEMMNPAAGLAAPPHRYAWQAHARGLVAHLVYGLVTDAVLHGLQAVGSGSGSHGPEQRGGSLSAPRSSAGDRDAADEIVGAGGI